ncbi:MAG TPA: glutaredoxin domain-containing protein, partial [Phenylobacterium sp.]|nr:glutaredoxin domain-containing protein [Phenylobacterium sp.]
MANVTIYTKPYCPYCIRALDLLEKKGVAFTQIEAAFDPEKRREMN